MDNWIDYKEVSVIAKCKEATARKIIGIVNKEIREHGGIVAFKGRAPKRIVLEKLGLKENK